MSFWIKFLFLFFVFFNFQIRAEQKESLISLFFQQYKKPSWFQPYSMTFTHSFSRSLHYTGMWDVDHDVVLSYKTSFFGSPLMLQASSGFHHPLRRYVANPDLYGIKDLAFFVRFLKLPDLGPFKGEAFFTWSLPSSKVSRTQSLFSRSYGGLKYQVRFKNISASYETHTGLYFFKYFSKTPKVNDWIFWIHQLSLATRFDYLNVHANLGFYSFYNYQKSYRHGQDATFGISYDLEKVDSTFFIKYSWLRSDRDLYYLLSRLDIYRFGLAIGMSWSI